MNNRPYVAIHTDPSRNAVVYQFGDTRAVLINGMLDKAHTEKLIGDTWEHSSTGSFSVVTIIGNVTAELNRKA